MKFLVICFSFLLLVLPNTAHAVDWSVKAEPGFAFSVDSPQSELFKLGGDVMVKALFGLGPYLDAGPTVGFVGLPPSQSNKFSGDTGVGWQLGGGFRVKRPHTFRSHGFGSVSPWLDMDLMYVRTGPLNRFGFAVGAGLAFPVDQDRRFWLGPFIRYTQVVQPERDNYDNRDAKIVVVGFSLELGNAHRSKPHKEVVVVCPLCPVPQAEPPVVQPKPEPKVEPPKVRLMESVQFEWDSDILTPAAHQVLARAYRTIEDNKDYLVYIEGHASSEGAYEYNQDLSERRARVVFEYLANHGIPRARLWAKGFSSSVPLQSNGTLDGRVANRRVIFRLEAMTAEGGAK